MTSPEIGSVGACGDTAPTDALPTTADLVTDRDGMVWQRQGSDDWALMYVAPILRTGAQLATDRGPLDIHVWRGKTKEPRV